MCMKRTEDSRHEQCGKEPISAPVCLFVGVVNEEVSPTHSGDGGRVLSLNRHRTAFLLDLYRGRDAGFPQGARAAILNARAMIEVSIPSMHREVDEAGKTRKLFRLEILFNGRKHFVLRRQSDFHTLHRKLKKILQSPPEFPSKRTQLRAKPQEQRRQELEDYIQVILYENEVVPQELLDFLQVKHFHTANKICGFRDEQQKDTQEQGKSCELLHQRVVGFSRDPYLFASKSDLPDVVVAGVLQGFFPKENKMGFRTCSKPSIKHVPRLPSIPSIVIDRGSPSSLPEEQTT
ncbi:sorting nexin-22 [Ictalurus punctatus]|uniref:Sorting nexin-22 n=1 Tax=Ictalurus punctatus TaxID=7998 RepID=A0A2D0SCR5_ICTPU|nr:sorting nexin-22 [Ictalurus punctatus]